MPYPPVIPPANRLNSTEQLDNHPGDHNAISTALTALPWGPVAPPAMWAAGGPAIGQAFVNMQGMSVTATLLAGRRYRAVSYVVGSVAGVATYVRIRHNSSVAGVLIPSPSVPISTVSTNGTALIIVHSFLVGAGVAHTITTQAMVDAGNLGVTVGSYLIVEDVGLA